MEEPKPILQPEAEPLVVTQRLTLPVDPETANKLTNPQGSAPSYLLHFAAGLGAGVISTLVLHPLDLMKIRFAVDSSNRSQKVFRAFQKTVKLYGIRSLYQGVAANCLGNGVAWGSYFFYYNWAMRTANESRGDPTNLTHVMIAAQANMVSLTLSNPLSVVRTRLCLQMPKSAMPENLRYRGTFDGIRKIFKTEGISGLYRGFTPGLVGVLHGVSKSCCTMNLNED